MAETHCKICNKEAPLAAGRLTGYRSDLVFSIVECCRCGVSYVLPTISDPVLYEWIYINRDKVPGYSRYNSYFQQVQAERSPLSYLAAQEGAYWACADYLKNAGSRFRSKPRILEIGCGLGYLTYALRKEGYDVTGVDLSSEAVAKAVAAFGNFYETADILSDTVPTRDNYDIVIMTELLEHIPDPLRFLVAAKRLLRPNGEIFVTTPHKTSPSVSPWDTDLPPVHLYWFTPESLRWFARRLAGTISFIDFSEFNENRRPIRSATSTCNKFPTFSPNGSLLIASTPARRAAPKLHRWAKALLKPLGLTVFCRHLVDRIKGQERWKGAEGPTLAGWFKL